jgi:hypothetical protein
VADALSRLATDDRLIGETKELFSTVMQCLGADTEEFELHPVSYSHLDLAQQADPQIKKTETRYLKVYIEEYVPDLQYIQG